MPFISADGVLPGVIVENTRSGGWVGNLFLSGDVGQLQRLELVGAGASYFEASLNRATGMVTIGPAAVIDYEALTAAGVAPDLSFTLRYSFTDGSEQDDPVTRRVAVQDVDDTPPQGLVFISGGAVNAGDIGATIGTLLVTDPDTPNGPYYVSVAPEYEWMLQLDGDVLRLKDGISLQLDLIGTWVVPVLVSDGRNAAAFALGITVNPPGTEQSMITFARPGDVVGGVTCTALGVLTTALSLTAASALIGYGGGVWQLALQDGNALWLNSLASLTFADGTLSAANGGLTLRYAPAAGVALRATTTALDGSAGADRYDFGLLAPNGPGVQLAGMAGNDTLTGNGAFNLQASYDSSQAAVLVDLGAGTAQDGWGGADTLLNIRRVSATSGFNDTLRGSSGDDLFIVANAGTKLLDGRGGSDWVRLASAAAATLNLGPAKDASGAWQGSAGFASGGGAHALLGFRNAIGGTGNDSITGNADGNLLAGDAGSNTLTGGGGSDTVTYDLAGYGGSAATRGVTVNLSARNVNVSNPWGGTDRLVGITSAWGTSFADRLTGISTTGGYSYLSGGAGNDTLVAPTGSSNVAADYSRDPAGANINLLLQIAVDGWGTTDTLSNITLVRGSPFADTIWGGSAASTIWGNGGRDVVVLGSAAATVILGAEDSVVYLGGPNQVVLTPLGGNHSLYSSISLTLPSNIGTLNLQEGAGNINGTGHAGRHVLYGNSGNNLLTAGSGPSTLHGGGGNDTLVASEQTAALYGDAGSDSLVAGSGGTLLDGGPGNDTLVAGSIATTMLGGEGDDSILGNNFLGLTIRGGAGNDTVSGGSAVYGDDGNDYLWRPRGKASVYGGNGDDVLVANNQGNLLDGGPGNDTIYAGSGADTIDTGTGTGDWIILTAGPAQVSIRSLNAVVVAPANNAVTITLYASWWMGATIKAVTMARGAGNLWAVGSDVDCTITGNEGNNVLHAGTANCTLLGMDGNDLIYAGARTTLVMGGNGEDWIVGGSGDGTLDGGAGRDNISAGQGRYLILGGEGNDWLTGGRQNGTLDGGAGNDTLLGGDGDELLLGGGGYNWISCGNGSDTVDAGPGGGTWIFAGGSGRKLVYVHSQWDVTFASAQEDITVIADCDYALWPNARTLILAPGAGNLRGTGNNVANLIVGNEGHNVLSAGTGPATLQGGLGNDTVYGGAGPCLLQGGEGHDWLTGGNGATTLDGGEGNDVLGAGGGRSLLLGGTGNDWMRGGSGACTLDGGDGNDWLGGGSGACVLLGGLGNDTIVAGSGGSTIDGGGGANWITVLAGTAEITLRSALDVLDVRATAGAVTVTAWVSTTMAPNVGKLVLAEGGGDLSGTGNAGNSVLIGSSGNNRLVAGRGNASLAGGAGDDTLQGGTGADRFVYNAGDGADVILDFNPAQDLLWLGGLGLSGIGALLALAQQVGTDTLLDFGAGDTLLLRGIAPAALGAGNVWLA